MKKMHNPNPLHFLLVSICLFLIPPSVFAVNSVDCSEQPASAVFIKENGVLCLQKITIAEQPDSVFYQASLQWQGPDKPGEFTLLNAGVDLNTELNSPVFSTEEGILTLPKVDIPNTFGTERYVASLVLANQDDLSLFKLSSITVYINPDYIPNVTWKPYGMLAVNKRRAVDRLGRSLPYAQLADAVYDFDNTIVDQWVMIEKKDKNSGMQAAVYHNPETDELTLAFRGTETCDFPCSFGELAELALDTAADGLLTFGFVDTQFEDAMAYAQDVVNRSEGRKIIVTGHSLGGGLAQAVGAALGLETFAFNSAPVPDGFFKDYPPALPTEALSEIIHVLADIHDPVSNTDETGKLYVNADHVSTLLQFDFDLKEVLPEELRKLNDLRFDRHSMTRLLDNAASLISIYQNGW